MRKTDSTSWAELATTVIRTTYKAARLTTGTEYQFRVKAQNRYGSGPAISSENIIATFPFKVPGPPGTPQVIAVSKDSISISWHEPLTDGGSPILGYHIERKERNSILWQTVSKALISGNIFKSSGLTDGIAYEFRVIAENMAGKSKPSKPSEPTFALDPIDPPGKPVPLNITRHAVALKWTKPEYNGGFKITGYTVEKRDLPNGRWLKANFSNILETEFTVSGLTEDAAYEFRVIARNAAGAVSHPSEPSDAITCRDEIEAPRIMVDAKYKDTLVLKAGEVFKLEADVAGRPPPTLVWTKEGKELEDTAKSEIKIADFSTVLTNKDSTRRDGGAYTLTASNPGGFAKHIFNVKVLDRPGPPEGPLAVSDVTTEKCVLSWLPPLDDGGANIDHYVVEKRETSRLAWTSNEKGISDPRQLSVPVIAKDLVIPPAFKLLFTTFSVLAGEDLKVDVPFIGRPKPSIVWLKDNVPLRQTTRVNEENTDNNTLLTIKEACKEDVGQYLVKLSNSHADVPGTIIVEEKLEAPDLDLDMELRKVINVRAGGSLRLFVPIRGRPTPEVKWGKVDGDIREAAMIDITSSFTSLVLDNVNRFDSGKYTLTLENSSGTKSAFVIVRVLDTPGPPINLKIKDITKDSVSLAWEPPLIDGGAKIKNYIIEKREATRKAYAAVVTNCHKTSWKIDQLQEGCYYSFRVCAENEFGIGLPEETSDPVKVAEVPQPPGKITVDDVTRNSVSLSWAKPEHDGGSKILQYIVEMQVKGSEKWSECTRVKSLEALVTNLTQGEEYLFRVMAVNEKGKSDPRSLAVPIIAKDLVIEPDVRPAFHSYSIQVGQDLKIEVPISGRPKPTITWTKDGIPLKQTTRVNVIDSPNLTILNIKETNKEDSGMYEIAVANVVGQKSAPIEIVTLDKPDPPRGPVKFDDISAESITLSWNPPAYTGGCQITNYIVHKRDTTSTVWETVSATVARTTLKVSKLKTGSEYQFRIFAENRYGQSFALESEAVVAQYPYKEPGPPGTPFVTAVTKDSMVVQWHEPINDGGSKILGYHLERKEKNSILWTKVNKTIIQDTHYKTTNLEEGIEYEFRGSDKWSVVTDSKVCNAVVSGLSSGHEYQFRVMAYNEKGKSDPRPLAVPVIASDLTIQPSFKLMFNTFTVQAGEDLKVEIPFIARPKPTITWEKDGQPIKQTTRLHVEDTSTTTTLFIKESNKDDFGKYAVTATNTAGKATEQLNIIVTPSSKRTGRRTCF
uniref:Titin n=1 Tax=Anolis carolinensis TaxID=28377 RepID=A0A803TKH3_ANOCA